MTLNDATTTTMMKHYAVIVIAILLTICGGTNAQQGCCFQAKAWSTNISIAICNSNATEANSPVQMSEYWYSDKSHGEMYVAYDGVTRDNKPMSGQVWTSKAANGTWIQILVTSFVPNACYKTIGAASPFDTMSDCAKPPLRFDGNVKILGVAAQQWTNVSSQTTLTVGTNGCIPAMFRSVTEMGSNGQYEFTSGDFFNQNLTPTPPPTPPSNCTVIPPHIQQTTHHKHTKSVRHYKTAKRISGIL